MRSSPSVADHPARILIVDDEFDNRELLGLVLQWEGFVILNASSGAEALATVTQEPPDLILLDVMMPGMNGYQVASELKGNPASKHIPIIMVTALEDPDARARAGRAGAEDLLRKPLERAEVSLRVRSLLRKTYADYRDA